jgi:tetratricopeptide (TPR) repeat protein
LTVWPDSAETYLLASRAARRAGDPQLAEQYLRNCQRLERLPSEATVVEWALLRASQGDLDQTEDFLQERVRKFPDMAPLVWEALAEGYTRTCRVVEALRCLNNWLERQPDNLGGLLLRGNLHWQVKANAKAAEDYQRVVQLDPDQGQARRRLAIALLEVGRYREALAHLEQLHQRYPEEQDLVVRMARCHNRLGNFVQCRDLLAAVLQRYPDHGLALRTRGEFAFQDGNNDEGRRWLREAARVMPEDYQTHFLLHRCLEALGNSEAEAELEIAQRIRDRTERIDDITTHLLSARPRDADLQAELGSLLIAAGNRDVGVSWLHSALRLNPEHPRARETLAAEER